MIDLKTKISKNFDQLSPQLQKAARFILDHPDDVALKPVREIAELAGVTSNALVRLAKDMDFDGYAAFRNVFREGLRQTPQKISQKISFIQSRGNETSELFNEIEEQAHFNVQRTLEQINPQDFEKSIQAISNSKCLYVMGLRSCYPVAYSFYYAHSMFSEKACLIEGHAGTLGDQLRPIGPEDVLLVITTNPFSRDAVKAAEFAHEQGATVIALVDQEITPFDKIASFKLKGATHSKTLFASTTGLMTLSEIMLATLLSRSGHEAVEAMEQAQKQLNRFNAYWTY